jgi:FKBP-type peptidyl-prolyl cis-trans isomerase
MFKSLVFTTVAAAVLMLSSCDSKTTGFKQLSSGLSYTVIRDSGKTKAAIGDIVTINLTYGLDDSLFFTTKQMGTPIPIEVVNPPFKGSFEEGLVLLGVGDSAAFQVRADSVYEKIFQMKMPENIKPDEKFTFHVGVVNISNEARTLQEYLKKNNIQANPLPSGLIYLQEKPGTGAQAMPGKKVKVHYTGMLLDGRKFDSSLDRKDPKTGKVEPFEFTLGARQVIPGWDEGIGLMKVGEKGRLFIPSKLGYGPRGASDVIPGYATLIFEVELVGVE